MKSCIDRGLNKALKNANGPMTLEEIAKYCRCQKQTIWQIEQQALKKLRFRLRHYHDN